MKKIVFDFLATMPLKEIDKSPTHVVGGKMPVVGADFRLFSDGTIYPSAERIKHDQLEFQKKDSGLPEYGYDVFLSTDWSQYTSPNAIVCITKISKHLNKVDLFGRTKYGKDGNPKSSVINLKSTQGEDLIKYLEQIYLEPGETLFAHKTYVDLKIRTDHPLLPTETGIYNLPKKIAKGDDKGKAVYARRENIVIYPLEIFEVSTATSQSNASNNGKEVPDDVVQKVFA